MSLGQPGLPGASLEAARPRTVDPVLVETLPSAPSWLQWKQSWHRYTISKAVSLTVDARVVRVALPVYRGGSEYPEAKRKEVRTWSSKGHAIRSSADTIWPDWPWDSPQYAVPAPDGVVQLWLLVRDHVCTWMGAASYKISDVLIGIGCQCRRRHDKTKCVTTLICPGREGYVRRRVCVHDGILCPASLSICWLSVGLSSRDESGSGTYRKRPRSTRRRYVLRTAS